MRNVFHAVAVVSCVRVGGTIMVEYGPIALPPGESRPGPFCASRGLFAFQEENTKWNTNGSMRMFFKF